MVMHGTISTHETIQMKIYDAMRDTGKATVI